jgi:hypothetical protein
MNGRNFIDLALLVPGVSPTNVSSTQLFAETSAVAGPGLSVGSQRNFSNNFIVDGLSANDDAAGLSGIPYGVDAVDQFQVITSGGQAELGRALGGYVNVVTKSGTNGLHGDLYNYLRDDRFNAPNALSGTTLPMNQSNAAPASAVRSAGIGLSTFRTSSNADWTSRTHDDIVQGSRQSRQHQHATCGGRSFPGSPVTTGVYPNPVDSSNFLAKVDHALSGNDQFSVRYGLYEVTSQNSRGAGA